MEKRLESPKTTEGRTQRRKEKWAPFYRFIRGGKNSPASETECGDPCSSDDDDIRLGSSSEISASGLPTGVVFTEKLAYEFIWDYHEHFRRAVDVLPDMNHKHWKLFWKNYHTADFLLVRPSGNPLSLQGLMAQLAKGEISNYEEAVIMVDNIKCFGKTAVVVYKSETLFLYKGNKVEDFRTNTIVLVFEDNRPKITNTHRSTGLDIKECFKG